MKNGKKIYYWDTNIFLTVCKKEEHIPDIFLGAKYIINILEKGECILVTSVLTTLEFLEGINNPKAADIFNGILQRSNVLIQEINTPILDKAREIRITCKTKSKSVLHVPDAIHAATAIILKVNALHTNDDDLMKLKDFLMDSFGLNICNPPTKAQQELDLSQT